MKNRILSIIILSGLVIFLSIHLRKNKSTDIISDTTTKADVNKIAVSILPIKYLVDKITEGRVEVTVIVPPGASPETYEPTPQQIALLNEVDIIYTTGLIDFEKELINKISKSLSTPVVSLHSGIELIEGSCSHSHDSGSGHSHSHGIDPHIWTSPSNLKTMSKNILESISPLHRDYDNFKDNFHALGVELDDLDKEIKSKLSTSKNKYFIIYHPALTYYSRDYGITQISLEQEGKEPSADYIKHIVSDARYFEINKILYQKQFSRNTVQTVAEDIGAELVEFDPLAEDVIGNLRYITNIIAE